MNDWLPGLLQALRAGHEGYAGAQQYNVQQQQYEEDQKRKALLDLMRQQQMEQPEPEEPPKPQTESQYKAGLYERIEKGEITPDNPLVQLLFPSKPTGKTTYPKGDRAKVSGYIAKGVHGRRADISKAMEYSEEDMPTPAPITSAFIDTLRQEAMRIFQPRYPTPEGGTNYNLPMPGRGASQPQDSAAVLLNLLGGGQPSGDQTTEEQAIAEIKDYLQRNPGADIDWQTVFNANPNLDRQKVMKGVYP